MKVVAFFCLLLIYINQVFAYLGERGSPYKVTLDTAHPESLKFKRGDTIQINWGLAKGVRFPLYGYASARTSKTDIGLLASESSRTESYLYTIENNISVMDYSYTWLIPNDAPTGIYQIGVGFFYHEVSPEIHIIE